MIRHEIEEILKAVATDVSLSYTKPIGKTAPTSQRWWRKPRQSCVPSSAPVAIHLSGHGQPTDMCGDYRAGLISIIASPGASSSGRHGRSSRASIDESSASSTFTVAATLRKTILRTRSIHLSRRSMPARSTAMATSSISHTRSTPTSVTQ
jgi:hypothetical protein